MKLVREKMNLPALQEPIYLILISHIFKVILRVIKELH